MPNAARLDQIRHPYGPCPAAMEAMAHPPQASQEELAGHLRARLAEHYRVPVDAIRFFGDRERTFVQLMGSAEGPLIAFPPSGIATFLEHAWPDREQVLVQRGAGSNAGLMLERAMDLPADGVAIVDSPSDPLGGLLSASDAVRLARACRFVVIDERYAEFSGRSLMSLALEFENLAIIRTFDLWAGLPDARCAWTVMSPRSRLASATAQQLPSVEVAAAALATLDDLPSVTATLRMLREERSRLYRELRKLSLFEPLPSWGPFLSARVAIGQRDDIVSVLGSHGVLVHAPQEPGLERYIRFGIGSRSEMNLLRTALRATAPAILA